MAGLRAGWRSTAQIATASTPAALRVLRAADSQVRGRPVWSCQEIFWSSIHFAEVVGRVSVLVILGGWGVL